jgi:hypothetical protein
MPRLRHISDTKGVLSEPVGRSDKKLGRTMAVVESVAVLLHEHSNRMKRDKDRMCPWPISVHRKCKISKEEKKLPQLVKKSAMQWIRRSKVCGQTFCKIQPDLFQLRKPREMSFCRNKEKTVLAHITPSVRPSTITSRLSIKRTISLPPKMLPCIRQLFADIRINNNATPILTR